MHKTRGRQEKQDEVLSVITRLEPDAIQAVLLERAKQAARSMAVGLLEQDAETLWEHGLYGDWAQGREGCTSWAATCEVRYHRGSLTGVRLLLSDRFVPFGKDSASGDRCFIFFVLHTRDTASEATLLATECRPAPGARTSPHRC
jgi:hypothetical protein